MPRYSTFDTPLGTCALAFDVEGLVATVLPSQTTAATVRALVSIVRARKLFDEDPTVELRAPRWVADTIEDVCALLDGSARDFATARLDMRNLSDFRCRIYEAARAVPFGSRATYGELARAAGSSGAARAVGRAMATNPWPLLVPCHRIVSSQGELHGFSAPGGVRTKAALLTIEESAASNCLGPTSGGKSCALASTSAKKTDASTQSRLPF